MKRHILIILAAAFTVMFLFSSCSKESDIAATEESLSAQANQFVEELAAGDYKGARKNHEYGFVMGLLTGEKTLKNIWESLTSQYGGYVSVYEYEYEQAPPFESIIIKTAFENKCIDFKVTFNEGTLKVSGLHYSPNEDKPSLAGAPSIPPPDGVLERSFQFGVEGLELPAVLAYPEGDDTYPLVILVHGSGPSDADESVGNQTPFRDIAWGLAQQGIAVLRYDKRTLVHPETFGEDATVEQETIEDAMIAAITAQTIPEAQPGKTFILGHSLGGMMIPRIAEVTPEATGFIMMSASVTPLNELMVEQHEYIFNLDGKLSLSERFSLAKSKKMSKRVSELTADSSVAADKLFGISQAYWMYLNDYDVLQGVQNITRPLLVIQGESDYQVPMRDFEALEGVLSSKDNVTMISYPGLSHLMTQAGSPPSPDDYYEELNVDQQVIDDIAEFVKEN